MFSCFFTPHILFFSQGIFWKFELHRGGQKLIVPVSSLKLVSMCVILMFPAFIFSFVLLFGLLVHVHAHVFVTLGTYSLEFLASAVAS